MPSWDDNDAHTRTKETSAMGTEMSRDTAHTRVVQAILAAILFVAIIGGLSAWDAVRHGRPGYHAPYTTCVAHLDDKGDAYLDNCSR